MFQVISYDHVGVRVTDKSASLRFYSLLGFHPEPGETWEEHDAIGLVNDAGVRINLIYNGRARPDRRNILMDETEKWPGITHIALVVDSLDRLVARMTELGIPLTGGPERLGERRAVCFIRDPDGNVIEFDELYARGSSAKAKQ
jgi:catechol 2,3-dioxygenase-like lactoylglutathione lyase family enzyme